MRLQLEGGGGSVFSSMGIGSQMYWAWCTSHSFLHLPRSSVYAWFIVCIAHVFRAQHATESCNPTKCSVFVCTTSQAIRVGLDGRLRSPPVRGATLGSRPEAGGTADEGQNPGVWVPASVPIHGALPASYQDYPQRGEGVQYQG